MQEKKGTWRGGGSAAGRSSSLVTLRWRPVAVVAHGRRAQAAVLLLNRRKKDFFLFPSSFFVFGISLFSFLSLCFRFSFLLFSVYSFLFSLSLVRSLSSPLSLSCVISPPFSPRVLSIYRKKTEQVCLLLVRLQSRNGWSASDPFDGLVGLRWG